MQLINIHEIESVYGNKTIELYYGDLTQMDFPVDCIVASAYRGGYHPTKGSLLGALHYNLGILAEDLMDHIDINLAEPLNVWISKELDHYDFKRLAFVEIVGTYQPFEQSIRNLFSLVRICEVYDIELNSIAMPILGTGQQRIPPEMIMPVLLEHSIKALQQVTHLRKVIFVELNEQKLLSLDQSMNNYLQRQPAILHGVPKTEFSQKVIDELLNNLVKLKAIIGQEQKSTINDLSYKLNSDESRIFEIGILARKLIELMVRDILKQDHSFEELSTSIRKLHEKNIALWIISYLHLIRIFGNISAHSDSSIPTTPKEMNENDFNNLLFCLNRVTDFWYTYKMEQKNN
ncbi:MAG: DUF4145 domain-containing protein [Bacteroidales bacterium]|nr:DUF4145 domain-containing protein [Bacteroidales bacterium]